MKLRFFVAALFTAALAAACSSDDSSDNDAGTNPKDDASMDAKADAPAANDASTNDVAPKNDASPSDAGNDASQALPQANPPSGATLCKQGTISPADVASGCEVPVTFGPPPIDGCKDVTSNGGQYQVWCGPTSTYVWAEIDSLAPLQSTCPVGAGHFIFDLGTNYTFAAGNGSGAGPATLTSTGNLPYSLGTSRSFVVEATLPTAAAHGSFTIWETGSDTICPQEAGTSGVLVAGVSKSW